METGKIPWSSKTVALLVLLSTVAYINGLVSGEVKTAIVTWIVVFTSAALNLAIIVLRDKKLKIIPNIVIVTAVTGQFAILIAILLVDASMDITLFDIYMFIGSVIGFSLFLWKRKHAVVSAAAINIAIIIGFLPLWKHLWNGGTTESLSAWALIAIASAIGLIDPYRQKDGLALIYPLRSTLTSLSVVVLTLWNTFA